MKKISWKKYYEKFLDWSIDEQIKYSDYISNYGDSEEVYDVLMTFVLDNKEHAKVFAKRVCTAGVRFTPEEVIELYDVVEIDTLSYMAKNTSTPFSKEELIEIYPYITNDAFEAISNTAKIDIFEDSNAIYELLTELILIDEQQANTFAKKVFLKRIYFTPEQILEFTCFIDKETLSLMAIHSTEPFNKDQLEEIYLLIDDKAFETISKRANIDIFEDEYNVEEYDDETTFNIANDLEDISNSIPGYIDSHKDVEKDLDEFIDTLDKVDDSKPNKGPGFLATLLGIVGGMLFFDGSKYQKHNGVCDGDCANCPPHYGYRYGRWYYGHSHVHGCEFGGNKGDGGRD